MGVVEIFKALEITKERGLDLVEVAPLANPPVCRIIDFGKYQYQKARQERKQQTKQKKTELKNIRISLRTGQHDLETKIKQAEKFLSAGHKVRIDIVLKGREKSFPFQNLAKEKLGAFLQLIPFEVSVEREIKREGQGFNIIISSKLKA